MLAIVSRYGPWLCGIVDLDNLLTCCWQSNASASVAGGRSKKIHPIVSTARALEEEDAMDITARDLWQFTLEVKCVILCPCCPTSTSTSTISLILPLSFYIFSKLADGLCDQHPFFAHGMVRLVEQLEATNHAVCWRCRTHQTYRLACLFSVFESHLDSSLLLYRVSLLTSGEWPTSVVLFLLFLLFLFNSTCPYYQLATLLESSKALFDEKIVAVK